MAGIARDPMSSNLGSICKSRALIFRGTKSSARVTPIFTIAVAAPTSCAVLCNRNADMVIIEEPSATKASHSLAASIAESALPLGTLSPKKTTFGFNNPLHFGQTGIWKSSSQNFSSISISPSGLCFIPKLLSDRLS
nr:hypothetical protein Iba_chr11aCG4570 [Ipomoea batatas]